MRLATIAVLGLLAAGCGGDESEYSVMESPDYMLLGETLEHWASYGDQLSVIAVTDSTGERPAERNSGGLIGRHVTVRVERTLWRREGAPKAPATLRISVWGWMQEDDQDPNSHRAKLVSAGAPRMEAGRRYLAVLVRARGEWFPLTDQAVMTLSADDTVTSEVISGDPSPAASAVRGKTIEQAARVVASTPPHPVAARNAELPPVKRMHAVLDAGG
jgi:hypothetical protein